MRVEAVGDRRLGNGAARVQRRRDLLGEEHAVGGARSRQRHRDGRNRGSEGRDDKRPSLADLRGAGAFEEDSDAVIFLYRPAYYLERSAAFRNGEPAALDEHRACRHELEFIIDKNRAGRSNQVVRAWIDPGLNAIRNLQFGA